MKDEEEEEYITLFLSSNDEDLNIKLLVSRSSIIDFINNYKRKEVIKINSFFSGDNLDNKIRNIIHELGVSSNLKGYRYLIDSIKITIYEDIVNTNDIYVMISKKYKVSTNSVEHAIKKAIVNSFNIGNITLINKIFGYSIRDIPTNTQYILMVSEYITLQLN